MSGGRRSGRARLTVLGGVALGLTLAACSTAMGPSARKPAHHSHPRPATPVTTPTPCPAASLAVFGGRQSSDLAGDVQGTVVVANISATPCLLSGAPSLGLLGIRGVLAVQAAPGGTFTPVTLVAGALASFTVQWANWCALDPGTLQVSVDWPTGASVRGPFDGPPDGADVPSCLDQSRPSTIAAEQGYLASSP